MSIVDTIELVLASHQRDAEVASAAAARIAAYANGDAGERPTDDELLAFRRATGARELGRDLASRILRSVRVREAIAACRPVAASDLAAACGCSRQWIMRQHGSLVPVATAVRVLRERGRNAAR